MQCKEAVKLANEEHEHMKQQLEESQSKNIELQKQMNYLNNNLSGEKIV